MNATTLVDPEVSRHKFRDELHLWKIHSDYRRRGWLLLDADEEALTVEVAFIARATISTGSAPLAVFVSAIRLEYDNYDLLPPSLTFIDPVTREPVVPHVRAFLPTSEGPRDVLVDGHPLTGRPFLCLPGIREYHTHPQHTGDDWLLHRPLKEGSILTVCDRVWRMMATNVIGFHIDLQGLPGFPLRAQVVIHLTQGDVQSMSALIK